MNALVYPGPGKRSWDEVPDPTMEAPTDDAEEVFSWTRPAVRVDPPLLPPWLRNGYSREL